MCGFESIAKFRHELKRAEQYRDESATHMKQKGSGVLFVGVALLRKINVWSSVKYRDTMRAVKSAPTVRNPNAPLVRMNLFTVRIPKLFAMRF